MVLEVVSLQLSSILELLFAVFFLLTLVLVGLSILVGICIYKLYQLLFGERHQDTRKSATDAVDRSAGSVADFIDSPAGKATLALLESIANTENTANNSEKQSNSSNIEARNKNKTIHSPAGTKNNGTEVRKRSATVHKENEEVRTNEYGELKH